MATKSYQNHELILTERLRRQEKAVIAYARKIVRLGLPGGGAVQLMSDRLRALDETTAKLRALKRAEKTGLQAGRP